ncbi:MAG: CSLREA domain-containing protein [Alphaproteobacteria bacterium]|nr:CSLREA domain-containing protein [Alphaproteobacteria bacterium]
MVSVPARSLRWPVNARVMARSMNDREDIMRKLATSTCVVAALALLAFAMPALTSAPASAKPITVNSTNDDLDGVDGDCTLREAINSAQSGTPSGAAAGECPGGKGSGVVKITFDLDLADDTITLTGQLPLITERVKIVGPGPAQLTIIVGGSFRHFRVTGGANLTLSGVRLTEGAFVNGGAIRVEGGSVLSLSDCVLNNNAGTSLRGGAINIVGSSTVTVSDCTFFANTTAGSGGAISNENSTLIVSHSNFFDNTVPNVESGGAIINEASGGGSTASLTVYHSTFSGNTSAGDGGAIGSFSAGAGSTSTIIITDSTIVANDAANDGGGVNNHATTAGSTSTMTIIDSIVAGNTAGVNGFDIHTEQTGGGAHTVSVTNTVFDDCAGASCPP